MNTELFELVVPNADLSIVGNSEDDLIIELGHQLFLANNLDHVVYFNSKCDAYFYNLVIEAKNLLERKGYHVKVTSYDVKVTSSNR